MNKEISKFDMRVFWLPIAKGRFKKSMVGKTFNLCVGKNKIQGVDLTKKGKTIVVHCVRPRFKYERIVLGCELVEK